MSKSLSIRALAAALLIAAGACGSDDGGTGPAAAGALTISVTQASAVPELVHVTGPAGYSQALTTTKTLLGIPFGLYSITADSQEIPNPVVGGTTYAAQVTGSPASVEENEFSHASVAYAFAHQRGALWVANIYLGAEQFGVDQLKATRVIVPSSSKIVSETNGLVFAPNGDMWVSVLYSSTLHGYDIANRNDANPNMGSRDLQSDNLGIPEQMVFDANGTLWVADYFWGLVGFSAAQVAAGGQHVSAAFSIQDAGRDPYDGYSGMQGIAIDGAGNVWVSESNTGQVVEFSAAQLTHSDTVVPVVRLKAFANPSAIAFDSHGDLWVANEDAYSIAMFTPAQLAIGGTVIPTVTIAATTPGGLAFDDSGNLWVSDKYESLVYEFTPAQLLATGTPVPTVVLRRGGGLLGPLAFDSWTTPAVTPPPSGAVHFAQASIRRDSTRNVRSARP